MEYEYFLWLVRFVDPKGVVNRNYYSVLRKLFNTTFTWDSRFPEDEDRAKDGVYLREIFLSEGFDEAVPSMFLERPCNVLEMLVGLSRRIEFEILAWPGYENAPRWFWMFIENLGISERCPYIYQGDYVDRRVNLWMKRSLADGPITIVNIKTVDKETLVTSFSIWKQVNGHLILNRKFYGF